MRYLIVKYIKTPDGKYQEQAQVLSRVNDRDWSMAAVILDYQARTVVKAVIDGKTLPKSFDRFDSYYREFFSHAVDYLRTKHQHQGTETTAQVEQISD